MRYLLLVAVPLLSCSSVLAADHDRNVATKLTVSAKPQVRVMTATEIAGLSNKSALLELDTDPNQIVCREVRVGVSSRLTKRSCKTRAEYRRIDEKRRSLAGKHEEDATRAPWNQRRAGINPNGRGGLRGKVSDAFK